MVALTTFLDLAPMRLRDQTQEFALLSSPEFLRNVWSLAHDESRRILQIVQQVVDDTVEPSCAFTQSVPLPELVRSGAEKAREAVPAASLIEVDVDPTLPPMRVDPAMGDRLWKVLLTRAARLNGPGGRVTLSARERVTVWGAPGVRVLISCDGEAWNEERLSSLFTVFAPSEDAPSDLGTDLLSAFFIAHHHGGEVMVHQAPPDGPGFEVRLPFDPEAAERPTLEQGCAEKLFTHVDTWDALRRS
jgi:K+-sensing histidine kinase KdpD